MKSQSSVWMAVLLVMGVAAGAGYRLAGKPIPSGAAQPDGLRRAGALGLEASPQASEGDDSLRRQVAQLQLQVAALTTQLNSSKPGASAQDTTLPAATEPQLAAPAQLEHEQAMWREHMTAVAADFEAEQRDARWAQSNAAMLQERASADSVLRSAIKQIECRSTICRVEMLDDQKGPFGHQLPVFLQSLGSVFPTAQVATATNPDGTKTLSIYFSTTTGDEAPGSRGS